jgi:hypothetical protein
MKKLIFIMTIVLFTGVNMFAQRSTAFVTNGGGKAIDENTFVATFVLNNINNAATLKKFTDAFRSYPSVTDVKFTLESDNKAAYSVTLPKKQHLAAIQKMFILAGIEDININGKVILTKDMLTYAEELKKQRKAKQRK